MDPSPQSSIGPRLDRAVRVAREHVASAGAALEIVRADRPGPPVHAGLAEAEELLDQVQVALDRLVP